MKVIKRLSPTAIKQWYENRDEFYLQRLAEFGPPRMQQTQPMSIGSAFDAHCKSYLHQILFGNFGPDIEHKYKVNGVEETHIKAKYDPHALLCVQVEEHNREWAFQHGKILFDLYKASGALANLIKELETASESPRFEFEIEGVICLENEVNGVRLLGKPDIYFKSKNGLNVILDWKVNGYCGKANTSPKPGYIRCIDGWTSDMQPHTPSHMSRHKNCVVENRDGLIISTSHNLENVNREWADQLMVYSWLMGEKVGSNFVVGIEQLCGTGSQPYCRIATHRSFIAPLIQFEHFGKICKIMTTVDKGPEYIFQDQGLNLEESAERCRMLDTQYQGDSFLLSMARGQ